jgi:ADP-ribose pyrophosphatase YjhB (NUDIX family)
MKRRAEHLDAARRAEIEALERAIDDPHRGLPEDIFLFLGRLVPMVNVDLLIQDDRGRTLLTWRDDEHFGSGWHVPGSVIRYKEPAADRVRACARDELGAEVSFADAPVFVMETIRAERDRGHAVSLLYRCRLSTPADATRQAGSGSPSAGQWRWHDGAPPDLLAIQQPYSRFF